MSVAEPTIEPKQEAKKRVRKPKDIPGVTRPMTYEEYLASPEEMARYDIIDGYKVYYTWGEKRLPNPTRDHQRIQRKMLRAMEDYAEQNQVGEVIQAPCDVLVRTNPTKTRQPDLLLISRERLALNPPSSDPTPLSPAPELVVEILSPSDTRRVRLAKIADFSAVDVRECWLVSADAETVEVLHLSSESEPETVAVYGHGQIVASLTFAGLGVAVNDIFAVS